jgi:hypothetical protein
MSDVANIANERARKYAESATRVYVLSRDEAVSAVARGKRTKAQAFAVCRRKYEGLRKDFFALKYIGGDQERAAAWVECGPDTLHYSLYRDWFSPEGAR